MRKTFEVTIASELNVTEFKSRRIGEYALILDLRRCANKQALPIEEQLLRLITNYRVQYEQMPINLYSSTPRQENDLFRCLTEQRGPVLVLTDHETAMINFCLDFDIPCENATEFDPTVYPMPGQVLSLPPRVATAGCWTANWPRYPMVQ